MPTFQGRPSQMIIRDDQIFQIIEGPFTWQEAMTDAESRGGRLAVLNTQERYEIARPVIESFSDSIWIGLTDEVIEGEYGSPGNY